MSFEENETWGTKWANYCIKWLLKNKCCWRCRSGAANGSATQRYSGQISCNAEIEFDTEITAAPGWYSLYDVDAVVRLNCAGCPLLGDAPAEITQYHEFKANKVTHEGIKTQNLAVEVIENDTLYEIPRFGTLEKKPNGKIQFTFDRWEENPLTHVDEQVIGGAGWWIKRDKVKRRGRDGTETIVTDDPLRHASWYHFIQMFDPTDVIEVSESAAKAFIEDDTVAADAALIRYYPLPYVVSVEGEYLDKLIKHNGYNANGYLGHKKYENKTITRYGYLIPVGDVVPSNVFDVTTFSYVRKSGILYSGEMVKVNLLNDGERRERDNKPISWLVKKPLCNKPSKIYIPKEIIEKVLTYSPLPPIMYDFFEWYIRIRKAEYKEKYGIECPMNIDLDEARIAIVKADTASAFKSRKRGQVEILDFITDLVVNRWCYVYPPDEGI